MRSFHAWSILAGCVCIATASMGAPAAGLESAREGYEIFSHHARLQLYPQANALSCIDTLLVHLTRHDLRRLEIRLSRLYIVTDVTINARRGEFQRNNDRLVIDGLPPDTLFSIVISYSGTFPFRSEFSSLSAERAILREEEVFPMGPKSYRDVRISLIVPKEWETTTVGDIVMSSTERDSLHVVWELRSPIPEIGWICAGRYLRRDRGGNGVPVTLLFFHEDSSAVGSVDSFAQTILDDFSKRFTLYRFSHLNIIEIEDWVAGKNVLAIAAPSFIMVKKNAFITGDMFNKIQSALPHEIAHQWWPLTVFINDEDAALLSEGMCEYSSILFAGSHGARSKRDSLSVHPLLRPLLTRVMKGEEVPLQQKADLRSLPTHYLKAAYVHNMLRQLMGLDAFDRLYREYAKRYRLRLATMTDFIHLAEEISGKKLDWFFEQWVQKNDIPRLKLYNVHSVSEGTAWITRGRVRLLGYERFTTFVDVGVLLAGETRTVRIFLGADASNVYHNDVPFEISTSSKPRQAVIDPRGDILKYQELPMKLSDLRDPSDGTMIVGTRHHAGYLLQRARRDSAEMDLAGWSLRIVPDTVVTLAALQHEHIFLYGGSADNRISETLHEKFPLRPRGDTVNINGQDILDSTLTLIQIIESPFLSQGSVCWIVPFSERAQTELLPFDASWVLARGTDEISSGIWNVNDQDLKVEIK